MNKVLGKIELAKNGDPQKVEMSWNRRLMALKWVLLKCNKEMDILLVVCHNTEKGNASY